MSDTERNALIPLRSGGLANIGTGPKSILSGMVSDALALARAREKSLAVARFRIGEYEFRAPDYRQILIWTKALGIEPEDFISRLKEDFGNYQDYLENSRDSFQDCDGFYHLPLNGFEAGLEVEDGSIVSLVWIFDEVSISSFEWMDGLRIKRLWFQGSALTKISLRLPSLNYFDYSRCHYSGRSCCKLTELDLLAAPALTNLYCDNNELVKLDLSAVPALTWLGCDNNQLVKLDLSAVPALAGLGCDNNQFVKLDLSAVPVLTWLGCAHNQLVELDLSNVPALTELDCSNNQLIQLEISNQELINLNCSSNPLIELKLSSPVLTDINCSNNQLVELDLYKVPALMGLDCRNNQLVELDLSGVPELRKLDCRNNKLVELDIRWLDQLKILKCDPLVKIKKFPTQNPRILKNE